MGRYSGTLANLVEEAIAAGKPSRSKNNQHNRVPAQNVWNKVLHYLENHSTTDGAIESPDFASPLPPYSVPSEILDEQLLERKFGPRQDNTILKLAVTAAPAPIVAALCHLQPHAARIPDHRGKLSIHVACRRNPNDPDTLLIFDILLAVYMDSLAYRDSAGRTPLHCLFMYHHAPHRSVETVTKFCQALPPKLIEALQQPKLHSNNNSPTLTTVNSTQDHHHDLDDFPLPLVPCPSTKDHIPPNAAIIPDARHGCLPLQYAVMEGASRDVLRFLLQVYPDSKRWVDRKGRTALAWYLGAGQTTTTTPSGTGAKLLVTGEPTDPHSVNWWDKNKIESATVQLLLNSRSARMTDATRRAPLHWAMCTLGRNQYYVQHPELKRQGPSLSMKTIHLLLDHYMEGLVQGDLQEKTPLHLLFDAVKEVQEQEWKRMMRNKTERNYLDLRKGGRKNTSIIAAAAARTNKDGTGASTGNDGNFNPPIDLLEILVANCVSSSSEIGTPTNAMMEDRSAVFMEDNEGRLPIHAALEVASSAKVIKLLIRAHPTSLVHTTEETLLSPLHTAVSSPCVAPLQTPETMRLILRAYVASRHGTYVDGRLALKMEDADGNYPIHYACKNNACLEVLQMFVEEYPKCALLQAPGGTLPLHNLLDKHVFEDDPDGFSPLGASLASRKTWSSSNEEEFQKERLSVLQEKIRLLLDPILHSANIKDFLQIPSLDHGMLPIHIVIAWGAGSYPTIKRMLNMCPSTAEKLTTVDGHKYSPLYLHENFKAKVVCTEMSSEVDQEWQYIRELLFSYSPLLEGHRRFKGILTQSVRVVRAEIGHAMTCEGEKSYHWTIEQDMRNQKELPTIEMSDTFALIEVPDIDHGGRPLSKKAIERSRQPVTPNKKKKTPKNSSTRPAGGGASKSNKKTQIPKTPSGTKKSIYDDDVLDTGYVVSDGEQDGEDFDEDYFSGPESDEEYLSDEPDERFESFDDEDFGHPTITTATGSWDTSGAADPASKETACRRNEKSYEEEKKQEEMSGLGSSAEPSPMRSCGPQFSEVGMRLLTFFMLYYDEKNPSDNYVSLAEEILDEVSRAVVEEVISMPLPPYASQYLEDGASMDGLTLRHVASPKCRELIYKLFYFLGRFDFKSETGGILLNKTADSSTVQVRSTEWTFSTEEYNEAPEVEPGVAEAQVWETGVIPPEEVGYMGAAFKAMRRSICFTFTKNSQAYYNEVNCRADLGVAVDGGSFSSSHIVPLISHFDATSLDQRQDRMYRNDSNNESFMMLDIFGQKGNSSTGESICLADYPYALVFPYSNYGDLFDYFYRHGVDGIEEAREICTQIGKSLSSMHEKGIIHGNVSMRNIVLFPPVEDVELEEGRKHWALTNLSGACRLSDSKSYMGKVSSQGMADFYSATLPPEMFVKLTSKELKVYREYWDYVEATFNVSADRSIIEPVVDYQSGSSYVMRCHFVPSEENARDAEKNLPSLPYKLLPARESADIWAFGQLLFMLCSSGRPLFPTNARTGSLLNYKDICNWDAQAAEAMVYEYVDNPLSQDILLRLLAPYEKRASLSMETLLNHPFFNDGDMLTSVSKAIAEKRNQASLAFRRWLENNVTEKSEESLLLERTITISCWDFDFQKRIHLTPTALLPELLSMRGDQLGMPSSFLILPYKLVRNKKGVLTPPSKRDVERAERLGLRMLSLSKACHFVNAIKKIVTGTSRPKGWSFATVFDALELSKEDFHDFQTRAGQLAAEHVELFRSEPLKVGIKLIQEEINEFLDCYDEASKVSLFLVDEYKGVPAVSTASDPFPHMVESSLKLQIAHHSLPFMYLCARYFRSIAGIPGFVKLIFEAASPHIPPSWQPVCQGLDNSLDRQSIVDDMSILCDALAMSFGSSIDDSFRFMQRYISEVDQRRTYANLKRVSSGEASVWTGPEGVNEIQQAAKVYGFKEAIEAKLKTDQKLFTQQARIKELEAEIEKLKFRNEFAPNAAQAEAPESAAMSLITPIFSPTEFAASLIGRGIRCVEASIARRPSQDGPGESSEEQRSESISQTESFETTETSPSMLDNEIEAKPNAEALRTEEVPPEPVPHSKTITTPTYQECVNHKLTTLGSPGSKAVTPRYNPSHLFNDESPASPLSSPRKMTMESHEDSQHQINPMSPKVMNNENEISPVPTEQDHDSAIEELQRQVNAGMTKLTDASDLEEEHDATAASVLEQAIASRSSRSSEGEENTPTEFPHDLGHPTLDCSAAALWSYLQGDDSQIASQYVMEESTVAEVEEGYADGLLETLSFDCIRGVKQVEIPAIEMSAAVRTGEGQSGIWASGHCEERLLQDYSRSPEKRQELPLHLEFEHRKPQLQQFSSDYSRFSEQRQERPLHLEVEHQKPQPQHFSSPSLTKQKVYQVEPQVQAQPLMPQQPLSQVSQPATQPTQILPQVQAQQPIQPLMSQVRPQPVSQVSQSATQPTQVLQPSKQQPQPPKSPQPSVPQPPGDASFSKSSNGVGELKMKHLFDDILADADLALLPNPRLQPPHGAKSLPNTPMVMANRHPTHSFPSSPLVKQETRDEDGRELSTSGSDPASAMMDESTAFLEITHKELSELKQTLIAGRAAAKEYRAETNAEVLSAMFQKEIDSFQSELESFKVMEPHSPFSKKVEPEKSPLSSPRSPGKWFVSTTRSPGSSREPSEASGSMGGRSLEAGSVKRLANFFLNATTGGQQKPTINVDAESPDRPKLSSPQSRLRRAALELNTNWT